MQVNIANVPEYLQRHGLFCLWRYEDRGGKKTKVPYNPKDPGVRASSADRGTFATWKQLQAVLPKVRGFDGIGAGVFDQISAIDIDHCIDQAGELSALALDIVNTLQSYTEISPSGHGIRIFFLASPGLQYDRERYYINNRGQGLEIYISGMTNKFLTLTGNTVRAWPVAERGAEVLEVVEKYMKRPDQKAASHAPELQPLDLTDQEVIEKAGAAINGNKFLQLYRGKWEGLYESHSDADLALCNQLAFWTGRNADQIDRIFRASGLMRDKWERKDYRSGTIGKAISACTEVYTEPKRTSAEEDFKEDPETGIEDLLTCLSDVEEKPVYWLIENWIPKNSTTLIGADGGAGKTFVWCDLLAKISAGKTTMLDPGWTGRDPERVLYFSSEDSADTVLKKRLRDAGANMDNVMTLDIANDRFNEIKFENHGLLEQIIKAYRPVLCVFDPVQQFIPDTVKMAERNAMRRCLAPLKRLSDLYEVTFILMVHTNKRDNASGRKRLADSADLWDFARSVIMLGETGQGETRYLSHEKNSYGKQSETVLYTITDHGIEFQGKSPKRDRDFIADMSAKKFGPSAARLDAEEVIIEYLEAHGETEIGVLKEAVTAAGVSTNAFNNAKAGMLKTGSLVRKQLSQGRGRGTKWTINLAAYADFDDDIPEEFS